MPRARPSASSSSMKMMHGAAACADADEHLDEFRAGDREERHARFARHRAREQRLAGARRADQQHALGHARAQAAVRLRVAQEVHGLAQFLLRLVHARDLGERHLDLVLAMDARPALADGKQPAQPARLARDALREPAPQREQHQGRQQPRHQFAQESALHRRAERHAVAFQFRRRRRVDAIGDDVRAAVRLRRLQLALQQLAAHGDRFDVAVLELLHELAVRHRLDAAAGLPQVARPREHHEREDQVPEREPPVRFRNGRARPGSVVPVHLDIHPTPPGRRRGPLLHREPRLVRQRSSAIRLQ
jgi:hypothetical protein